MIFQPTKIVFFLHINFFVLSFGSKIWIVLLLFWFSGVEYDNSTTTEAKVNNPSKRTPQTNQQNTKELQTIRKTEDNQVFHNDNWLVVQQWCFIDI